MNKDLKTVPTVDLVFGMEDLETEIIKKIDEFYLLREEMLRRFPQLANEPAFDLSLNKGVKDEENNKQYRI